MYNSTLGEPNASQRLYGAYMNLRKMLKFRLPSEKNERILKFIRQTGLIPHHFTKGFRGKKHNDYLAYGVDLEKHADIHDRGIEDQDEAVLEIIKNLIAYVKHLEEK